MASSRLVWLTGLLLAGCAAAPGAPASDTVTRSPPAPGTPMTPDDMRTARPLPLPGASGGPARPSPAAGGSGDGVPGLAPGSAGDAHVP